MEKIINYAVFLIAPRTNEAYNAYKAFYVHMQFKSLSKYRSLKLCSTLVNALKALTELC